MSLPSIYGGLKIKVIDAGSTPLTFKCSSSDPLYIFDASNNNSAELRLTNKYGKYMAIRPSEDITTSFTLVLPSSPGILGKILTSDGTGGTYWSSLISTSTSILQPGNFAVETIDGITTVYFGSSQNSEYGTWKMVIGEKFDIDRFDGTDWIRKISLSN